MGGRFYSVNVHLLMMVNCPPEATLTAARETVLSPPWSPVVAGAGILAGPYRPTSFDMVCHCHIDFCIAESITFGQTYEPLNSISHSVHMLPVFKVKFY
jgi:hypothetical protein